MMILVLSLCLVVLGSSLSTLVLGNWLATGVKMERLDTKMGISYISVFTVGKTEMFITAFVDKDYVFFSFDKDTDTDYLHEVIEVGTSRSGIKGELQKKVIGCITTFDTATGFTHDGKFYKFVFNIANDTIFFVFLGE